MYKKNAKTEINVELNSLLEELASSDNDTKNVKKVDQERLLIDGELYTVIKDYQEGFDYQAFLNRYQDYFNKFDYIVGDWAFEQLRLRGFYQLEARKVPYDQKIDSLQDYLNEYCNFGCSYFVLAKETSLNEYPNLLDKLFKESPKLGRSDSSPQHSTSRKARRRRPNKPQSKKIESNINHQQKGKEAKRPVKINKTPTPVGKGKTGVKEEFQIKQNSKKNSQTASKPKKTYTQKQNFTIKQKEK